MNVFSRRALNRAGLVQVLVLVFCILNTTSAQAASQCVALANAHPSITYVSTQPASLALGEVRITFVGHATFRIETHEGITVATDYAGYAGAGPVPDVVTMNRAHRTHYTDSPDPRIKHVLRGWNPDGGAAEHRLRVGDMFVRNVPTDIRSWGETRGKDMNSIFIFESAGLCIGHLGHLHHTLGPDYLGVIGQLDVVMVPVDGSYTMDQDAMVEVLKLLKARLILPMHAFGPTTLEAFVTRMAEDYQVEYADSPTFVISVASLPSQPTVRVLPGY